MYSGWLTVATILNVSLFLKRLGLEGESLEEFFAILMIYVAAMIYLTVLFKEKDSVYAGIYIWALIWIKER
jgi:hypothetical protein